MQPDVGMLFLFRSGWQCNSCLLGVPLTYVLVCNVHCDCRFVSRWEQAFDLECPSEIGLCYLNG